MKTKNIEVTVGRLYYIGNLSFISGLWSFLYKSLLMPRMKFPPIGTVLQVVIEFFLTQNVTVLNNHKQNFLISLASLS